MVVFSQSDPKEITLPDIRDRVVFYCILNWGLGHVTRSIPIIRDLIAKGNQVILLSDGDAGKALRETFPDLTYQSLPSYNIRYPQTKFLFLSLILQAMTRQRVINDEKEMIGQCYKEWKPDIIISDNRYGCYHPACTNYFISHQLQLIDPFPLVRPISHWLVKKLTKPFKEIWIPDRADVKLSGAMADVPLSIPKRYIGFHNTERSVQKRKDVDILIVLSGPEPRRTIVENMLLEACKQVQRNIVFIGGNFDADQQKENKGNMTYYSRLPYAEVLEYMAGASLVICRSGYSTLIDLFSLGKSEVICIPTAGQPEQEYLATYWSERGWVQNLREQDIIAKLPAMTKKVIQANSIS